MDDDIIVGIDLGTTYSCVAVYLHDDKRVEVIPNGSGDYITPSQVAFTDTERHIGDPARNQIAVNPINTIFDVKRLIGRRFSDSSVQSDIKLFPFKVVRGPEDMPRIEVSYRGETKQFYPEEISSMILGKMKEIAEDYLECIVSKAVITVPAHFNDSQRQATKDAGKIAGLTVERILSEPTAAAIAYGLEKPSQGHRTEKTILVFDLGGGTFDVSILKIEDGVFEVLATDGDTRLGGEDFDNKIVEYFAKEFERTNRVNIRSDRKAMRRLKTACERAKRHLSSSAQAQIEVDALHNGIDLFGTLTRARFDELCADYFNKCITTVENCLKDVDLNKSQIDEVVMVGGSTRILKVQTMVKQYFDKDPCKSINPDEAVAKGAALQGAVLSGSPSEKLQGVVLHDVTPLSLGIKTVGELMSIIIPRNSSVPVWQEKLYKTAHDNQTSVLIEVYEGERSNTKGNNLLGEFELNNLPRMPRGMVSLTVTFEIDNNGILNVSAEHTDTGIRSSIPITNNKGRLSETEIAVMVEESRRYKQQDDDFRARVEAKNALDDYAFSMRNKARQDSNGLGQAEKTQILTALNEAIAWVESNPSASKEEFERKFRQLEYVCSPILGEH